MRYDVQVLFDRGYETLAYQLEAMYEKSPELEDDFDNLVTAIIDMGYDHARERDEAYEEGRQDGQGEGYEEGYQMAEWDLSGSYEEGYEDGKAEGYEEGYQEGLEAGQE